MIMSSRFIPIEDRAGPSARTTVSLLQIGGTTGMWDLCPLPHQQSCPVLKPKSLLDESPGHSDDEEGLLQQAQSLRTAWDLAQLAAPERNEEERLVRAEIAALERAIEERRRQLARIGSESPKSTVQLDMGYTFAESEYSDEEDLETRLKEVESGEDSSRQGSRRQITFAGPEILKRTPSLADCVSSEFSEGDAEANGADRSLHWSHDPWTQLLDSPSCTSSAEKEKAAPKTWGSEMSALDREGPRTWGSQMSALSELQPQASEQVVTTQGCATRTPHGQTAQTIMTNPTHTPAQENLPTWNWLTPNNTVTNAGYQQPITTYMQNATQSANAYGYPQDSACATYNNYVPTQQPMTNFGYTQEAATHTPYAPTYAPLQTATETQQAPNYMTQYPQATLQQPHTPPSPYGYQTTTTTTTTESILGPYPYAGVQAPRPVAPPPCTHHHTHHHLHITQSMESINLDEEIALQEQAAKVAETQRRVQEAIARAVKAATRPAGKHAPQTRAVHSCDTDSDSGSEKGKHSKLDKSSSPSETSSITDLEYPEYFDVIDPENKTGKITVPQEYIDDTIGKVKYCRNLQKPVNKQRDFSLCLPFHGGDCKLGSKCHSIHANMDFVNGLRAVLAVASTCCAEHGDARSREEEYTSMLGGRLFCRLEKLDGKMEHIRTCELARTVALEKLLASGVESLVIPQAKVCRLHQEDRCRFGRDCKNFHFCRSVHARFSVQGISLKAAPTTPERSLAPSCPTGMMNRPMTPPGVGSAVFSWGQLTPAEVP
mmetsp:Transcript_145946/g.254802  ORF Transcript_145946/g.254802 Transcript_145946/m.254802 type:complete len:773 (-) Transcript_145946:1164-3482(-)